MELIVRPHVMSDRNRIVQDMPTGKTISELIACHTEFDPELRGNLVVLVNGEVEDNFDRIPGVGDTVTIAIRMGGGDDGKSILSMVAMIVLAVFAPYAAGALGFTAGTTSFALVSAGIMMVGSMAINAIFAPPRAKAETSNAKDNPTSTYSFGSQANGVRQFGSLPRVYGRHKIVPDIAGLPYTLNVGDDTYFYGLYCFGYGPLALEDFRIGQNLITNYTDYDLNIIENFTSSDQLKFYKNDIWQEGFNTEVSKAVGPVTFTTRPLTDQVILDMIFQQGLVAIDKKKGKYSTIASAVKVEIRDTLVPGSTFQPFPMVQGRPASASRGTVGGLFDGGINSDWNGDGNPAGGVAWLFKGQHTFIVHHLAVYPGTSTPALPVAGQYIKVGPYSMMVQSATLNSITLTQGLPGAVFGNEFGTPEDQQRNWVPIVYVANDLPSGMWTISGEQAGNFPASLDLPLPYPSTWELRVTSLTDDYVDNDDTSYLWKRNVVALKSLKSTVPPMSPEVPLTIVEFRIKATGQLNGSVEEFTAVATSKLRQWRNNAWVVDETRNPAWIYLDILTGKANPRAVPDARVDLDKLKSWAVRNDQIVPPFVLPNSTCDLVVDHSYTIWELLQSISATGRAAPTMRDNKYSVIVDDETRTPVQMFSPRNSSNLQSTRSYIEGPHALRVKWIDPDANYGPNAAIVYRTGYNEMNATVFEDLETYGITSQEGAIRYGRYMMAQGLLRQERFSIDTDIENIICLRGDLVYVAHDVLMVGGETARIYSLDDQTRTIVLDAPLTLQFDDYEDITGEGTTYGIRVRRSNGVMTGIIGVVKLQGPVVTVITGAAMAGLKVGDLVVYGKIDSIVGQYTVDRVSPSADMAATISLEEYAPLVYEAEYTGNIPPYVPQAGASYTRGTVRQLNATIIEYLDDEVYPRCRIRLSWVPPVGGTVLPVYYNVYNIRADGTELFLGETKDLGFTTEQIDMWILGGSVLKYAVRAVYESSGPSGPAFVEIMLPARETAPPPNFDFFEVVPLPSGLRKYNFAYVNIPRPSMVSGGEIRYYPGAGAPPDWSNMVNLAGDYGTYPTSGVELSSPPAGQWTFGIRAVDQLGVLAETPLYFTITLPLSINEGAEPELDFTPPPTPTGFEVAGFFTRLLVEQDDPEYSAGGGHQSSVLYGIEYVAGDPLPTFANASLMQEFTGNVAQIAADMGTTYRLWLKWRTRAGVESVVPAGGVNGLVVSTAADISKLLDALTGQITEEQLYTDLAKRIDLIDAEANVPGSVAARIQNLAQTMETADQALAQQINTVQARINVRPNLLKNGGFELGLVGWTASPAAGWVTGPGAGVFGVHAASGTGTNVTPAAGSLLSDAMPATVGYTYTFAADTMFTSPTGTANLRLNFYNAAGASLGFTDGPAIGNHTFSNLPARRNDRALQMVAPPGTATYKAEFRWTGKTGTGNVGIRLAKVEEGAMPATFYTSEAGQAAIAASVQVEAITRAQQTGDLYAQYTVKLDLNGYISGIGLASTVSNGTPSSSFAVRADTFYIASPSGPGIAPTMPFIVRTTPTTIGGVVVPAGIYMTDAFIQNGTITNAKIANATIEDAKILNLSAAKINTGFLAADRIQAGTITADKLTVGGGKNLLEDSSWVSRWSTGGAGNNVPAGWSLDYNPSSWSVYTQANNPEWYPPGAQGFTMHQKTGREGNRVMYIQGRFPVVPGKRYEASVYSGAHRANGYVAIEWVDANGVIMSESRDGAVTNNAESAGGKRLDLFKRIGCFGFAPANAASALMRIVKEDTFAGQADSYLFLTAPMVAMANSAQVEFSPYSPTGQGVQITPSGITTPSIGAISANLGYISAGTLDIHSDNAGGWGYIRSAGKWYDYNNGWIFGRNANGETIVSMVCGAMSFFMSNNSTGSYASMDWGGISFDSNGSLTVRAANVINTLNVAGGAVATTDWVQGNMSANIGHSVPSGEVHRVYLTAVFRGRNSFEGRIGPGASPIVTSLTAAPQNITSVVRAGSDGGEYQYRPTVTMTSLIDLGAGYHNLGASMQDYGNMDCLVSLIKMVIKKN